MKLFGNSNDSSNSAATSKELLAQARQDYDKAQAQRDPAAASEALNNASAHAQQHAGSFHGRRR